MNNTADVGPSPAEPQRLLPAWPRQAYLDVGRVLAIVAVVSIHTVGTSYQVLQPGTPGWWLANLGYESNFWAVPVFVMISGALVIPRAMTTSAQGFVTTRVGRLIVPLIFWVPLYIAFAAAFQDGPSTPGGIALLLASGRPYNHLYFLPLIIGLYLITPLIAPALHRASRRFVWTVALAALGLNAVDAVFAALGIGGVQPNLVTWWIPFVGYFLLGHAIATSDIRPGRLATLACAAMAIAAQDVLAWAGATRDATLNEYMGGYLTVTTIAAAIAVFLALRAWVPHLSARWASIWARLSQLTFGVYLGHLLIAVGIMHFGHVDGTSVLLTYLVFLVTVPLSFAAAEIASRVPLGRRLIGM